LIFKNCLLNLILKEVPKILLHNNRIRGSKSPVEVQVLIWFTDGSETE